MSKVLLLIVSLVLCIDGTLTKDVWEDEDNSVLVLPLLNMTEIKLERSENYQENTKTCVVLNESEADYNAYCKNNVTLTVELERFKNKITKLVIECDSEEEEENSLDLSEFQGLVEITIDRCNIDKLPNLPSKVSHVILKDLVNLVELTQVPKENIITELEIRNCSHLSKIEPDFFINMNKLRRIVIDHAPMLFQCNSIPTELPKTIRYIIYNNIGMSKTQSLCIPKEVVLEKHLRVLDLSNNYLYNIDETLSTGIIGIVNLTNTRDKKGNPLVLTECSEILMNLSELHLANNSYHHILDFYKGTTSSNFICFSKLIKLNLKGNLIEEITFDDLNNVQFNHLSYLDLSDNIISQLPSDGENYNRKMNNELVIDMRDNQLHFNCQTQDFFNIVKKIRFVKFINAVCTTKRIIYFGSDDSNESSPCDSDSTVQAVLNTHNLACMKPLEPEIKLKVFIKSKVPKKVLDEDELNLESREILIERTDDNQAFLDLSRERIGFTHQIECLSNGDPEPEMSWYYLDHRKKDNLLVSSKYFNITWNQLKHVANPIRGYALLKCIAKNYEGESSKNLKISLPKQIIRDVRSSAVSMESHYLQILFSLFLYFSLNF